MEEGTIRGQVKNMCLELTVEGRGELIVLSQPVFHLTPFLDFKFVNAVNHFLCKEAVGERVFGIFKYLFFMPIYRY